LLGAQLAYCRIGERTYCRQYIMLEWAGLYQSQRLPHSDQFIHLHQGKAEQLAFAMEWVLCQQMQFSVRPIAAMVFNFGPVYRVRGRLLSRQLVEQHYADAPLKLPWELRFATIR
jgi:hypothetical protein